MDNIAFTRDPRTTRAFFASPRSARAFGARFTFWLNIDYFRAHQRPSVIAHASDGFANNYPPSSTGEQSHRVRVVIARSHRRRAPSSTARRVESRVVGLAPAACFVDERSDDGRRNADTRARSDAIGPFGVDTTRGTVG
jgi:hypothetical protein